MVRKLNCVVSHTQKHPFLYSGLFVLFWLFPFPPPGICACVLNSVMLSSTYRSMYVEKKNNKISEYGKQDLLISCKSLLLCSAV